MNNLKLLIFIAFPVVILGANDLVCEYGLPVIPNNWIQMDDVCINNVRKLLNEEMSAAVQFLALAAHHFKTNVSRPGFANVFIESANHHRSNSKRLIDYLTMRGQNVDQINTLIQLSYTPAQTTWDNVAEALKFALLLEGTITDHFRNVIGVCQDQSFNDYNLNVWLTQEFLYTQYDDMKWYADTTSSLLKVWQTNGYYGEFQLDVGFEQEYSDDWANYSV